MPGFTPTDYDYAREDARYDERMDALAERGASDACRCFFDMPGRCPGPRSCPMCEEDDMLEEDDMSDEDDEDDDE